MFDITDARCNREVHVTSTFRIFIQNSHVAENNFVRLSGDWDQHFSTGGLDEHFRRHRTWKTRVRSQIGLYGMCGGKSVSGYSHHPHPTRSVTVFLCHHQPTNAPHSFIYQGRCIILAKWRLQISFHLSSPSKFSNTKNYFRKAGLITKFRVLLFTVPVPVAARSKA